MGTTAIIVAAGRGERAGGTLAKQYQMLAGRPVLGHAVDAFARHPLIDEIIVVTSARDAEIFDRLIVRPETRAQTRPDAPPLRRITGGAERAASVRAGLAASRATRVLIHDGARPLISQSLIGAVIAALDSHDGAAPALALTDALWRADQGRIRTSVPRAHLFRAQTPQGFHRAAILAAHAAYTGPAADDVEVALAAGLDVACVPGDEGNLKITWPQDFARAAHLLEGHMDIRCGNGFDVHGFCTGDSVMLCGARVPHSHALKGHSDADVGMHALTDAIYGALAEGDIGQHFPPSAAEWKDAASDIFLRHAMERVRARGFALTHADVTLICEAPEIGPHTDIMRAALSTIMGVDGTRISVKATTSEGLGFTGRGEGIAALATATLVAS